VGDVKAAEIPAAHSEDVWRLGQGRSAGAEAAGDSRREGADDPSRRPTRLGAVEYHRVRRRTGAQFSRSAGRGRDELDLGGGCSGRLFQNLREKHAGPMGRRAVRLQETRGHFRSHAETRNEVDGAGGCGNPERDRAHAR